MSDFQTSFNPVPLPMGPHGAKIEQYLKTMGCPCARGGESCHRRVARLCNLADRSRSVVRWHRLDSQAKEHRQSVWAAM